MPGCDAMTKKIDIAKALAPEDIRPGVYVSVLHIVLEHLGMFCAQDAAYQRIEPVRVLWLPFDCSPVEVVAVCLPFILVTDAKGNHCTLDVRRYRLARVSDHFGRKAFKRTRKGGCET